MKKRRLLKKGLLLWVLGWGILGAASGQKGDNQVRVLAEAGFPAHREFNAGVGGYVKFLYGVGRSGQVSLTTGLSKFRASSTLIGGNGERTTLRTIPVLAGYKVNIRNFYIEPAVGYGELGGRDYIGGDWARQSVGAFYMSLGAGYDYKRWTAGVRYQAARGAEDVAAGDWHRRFFEFAGVHVGYTLWQKPTPNP